MRTRKQWTSLLLVLSMILGFYIGGKQDVSAASFTNVKLSSDLILTWDPVDGANLYKVTFPFAAKETTETRMDLGAFMKEKRMTTGQIYAYLDAYHVVNYNYQTLASTPVNFYYTSPLPPLDAPTNIRISNNALTWDKVAASTGAEVTYHVYVSGPNYTSKTFETKDTSILAKEFATAGTYNYVITIWAMAEGHQDSAHVSATVGYTYTLPALQNFKIKNGIISWTPLQDAKAYDITYQYGTTSATRSNCYCTTTNGVTSYNLGAILQIYGVPLGTTMNVTVTAKKRSDNNEYIACSQSMTAGYTFTNETYPLKFYGKNLTTVDNPLATRSIEYFPEEGVLDLSGTIDFRNFPGATGSGYTAVFESDRPLTIIGSGTIYTDVPLVSINGEVKFASNSDFYILSYTGSSLKANSFLFYGKRLEIDCRKNDAVVAKNGITFTKSCETDIKATMGNSALTSQNGTISLGGLNILAPENGTLGYDKRHVYESDGKTVASSVVLSVNTPSPTPTKAPTNSPTPTNTPTPTKKPTNPPTPTKRPTNTNTPTPTKKPTNTNTPTPTPKKVTVPDAVGMEYQAATTFLKEKLKKLGFKEVIVEYMWTDNEDPPMDNKVLIQMPSAGKTVNVVNSITITLYIADKAPTPTPTKKPTNTNTPTPTKKPTNSPTPTKKATPTSTNTPTPTKKPTNTNMPTPTKKATPTNTRVPTPTMAVCRMPDVVGMHYLDAQQTIIDALKKAKFSYKPEINIEWVTNSVCEESGKVKEQNPLSGTYLYDNRRITVTLYVAKEITPTPTAIPTPGEPANVSATAVSGTKVNVSWNAVSGAAGYEVFRSTSENGNYTKLGAVTTTSRDCPGLTSWTTYYFKVRAYTEIDGTKVYGDFSSVVSAMPIPAAATGLKTKVLSATKVNVSWNAVNGADGYEVYRCTTKTGTYSRMGTVTTTSRDCPGLTTGKTYYFKVRAYKEVDGVMVYGPYSSVVSAVPKPTAPTNVKATVLTATKVNVSWNAVAGVTGYEVYRSTSETGTFSKCGTVTTTDRDCPGLTTGKTYYFKIRAYKEVNGEKIYGDFSEIVSVVTKA